MTYVATSIAVVVREGVSQHRNFVYVACNLDLFDPFCYICVPEFFSCGLCMDTIILEIARIY